jgi:gamma-glutamyltranspeptidase/glutathione hydrolase
MVVSVEPHATQAGVDILERGGNAMDAAVAVGFALAVTHPNAGNLGGGGFLLYRPRNGKTVAIDFREKAPRAVTQARFDAMIRAKAVGPAAAGVPGTVAGLDLALSQFGTLPRTEVLARAIELARKGFPLGAYQAKTIEWAWPALGSDPAARRIFGDHGKPKRAGDLLVQPELAGTLERIRDQGDSGFYAGETAAAISALSARGGMITGEDLAAYRAVLREPLRTAYRGFTVELAPPPSAGGVAVAIMLGLFETLEPEPLPSLGPDELHLFAEIARRAHAIRRFDVVDPDSVPGYDAARKRAEWLDVKRLYAATPPIDPAHATPSAKVHPLYGAAMQELEHTTHFSVADREGNVVSCTTTLSANFGAKVVAAGVVLNDSLAAFGTVGANVLAPERRMTSSMSPAIVTSGGAPVLVLGSPGGDTIPNTVVRVLRNLVDYGMTIDRAVDAPRVHHGFVPDEIRYESSRPPPAKALTELRHRGHRVSAKTAAMGDANSILLENGIAYGYADPREGGLALGPRSQPSPRPPR